MIKCHTKQWGNSLGIILPKMAVEKHCLKPHEDIVIEIREKTSNVLKELFGAVHFSKPTDRLLKELRGEIESRR